MIVYSATKAQFAEDDILNRIESIVSNHYTKKLPRKPSQTKSRSPQSSINYKEDALDVAKASVDARVANEYQIPQSSQNIDVLVTRSDIAKVRVPSDRRAKALGDDPLNVKRCNRQVTLRRWFT